MCRFPRIPFAVAPGLAFEEQVAELVKKRRLIRVVEDWCPPFPGFFLYYPSRRNQTWATDHAANNKVFPIVAGSNSSLTARHLEGTVAPNGVVFGNLGDVYTFWPTPTSAQIWFKATQSGGPNSNTGWVQK